MYNTHSHIYHVDTNNPRTEHTTENTVLTILNGRIYTLPRSPSRLHLHSHKGGHTLHRSSTYLPFRHYASHLSFFPSFLPHTTHYPSSQQPLSHIPVPRTSINPAPSPSPSHVSIRPVYGATDGVCRLTVGYVCRGKRTFVDV
jgi:hypothetical protein